MSCPALWGEWLFYTLAVIVAVLGVLSERTDP